MKFYRLIAFVTLFAMIVPTIGAVTDREMEQARTIAAQCYLRYANDGSGYLDDIKAATMAELEKKLKSKEKENIKAFKAINLPSDYAQWDKKQLVEFWSNTAFNTPGLLEKGKAARNRVRSRISAMTISVPVAQQETASASEQPTSEIVTPPVDSVPTTQIDPTPKAESEVGKTEEPDLAPKQKEDSSTWVYVCILVVLVVIVIALVVYAAKTMRENSKQQSSEGSSSRNVNSDDLREKFDKMMAEKEEELDSMVEQLNEANARVVGLEEQIGALRAEVAGLRKENSDLRAAWNQKSVESVALSEAGGGVRKRIIYLGRVNADGIFVRADRSFNPTYDVYCLETADGLTGSYYVVPDATLANKALGIPMDILGGGCEGDNLTDTQGFTSIDTTMRGVARFDGRCWRVERKARISYR